MVSLSLDWKDGLTFVNSPGSPAIELHSSTHGVTSPVQALGYAVMACMAMDVVHVIQKGRHPLEAMTVKLHGERATEHPRRLVKMSVAFDIRGDIEDKVIERAIDLSRHKNCSVWNSLRPDIELRTSFTIHR
jgi:putative redox protein